MRWRSCLRQCVTSRAVAVWALDCVTINFSLIYSFRQQYGSEVDSISNTNEYQVYLFWGKVLELLEPLAHFEACTGNVLHFT